MTIARWLAVSFDNDKRSDSGFHSVGSGIFPWLDVFEAPWVAYGTRFSATPIKQVFVLIA